MFAVDQRGFEFDVDSLLSSISPVEASNERRFDVVSFIKEVITTRLDRTFVVECGSSALRSYLPESDLDLVLLSPDAHNNRDEMSLLTGIFNALCDEISDKEDGKSSFSDMTIRNVEFVNARTKLAHCLVNNIAVDVTVNQVGALTTVGFLEEVDRFIGCDHLFKRSVLIIKTWSQHESAKYCGVPILGAKVGMLSSFAISVMVLHVFNKFTANLTHPFSVLRSFFFTYMNFPWDTHVLTLEGPQLIISGSDAAVAASSSSHYISQDKSSATPSRRPSRRPVYPNDPKYALFQNRFLPILHKYRSHPAFATQQPQQDSSNSSSNINSYSNSNSHTSTATDNAAAATARSRTHSGRFSIRCCNIQDPLDATNNLGISVSRANLQLIEQAYRCGYQHLENTLAPYALTNTMPNIVQFNIAAVATAPVAAASNNRSNSHNYGYNGDNVSVVSTSDSIPDGVTTVSSSANDNYRSHLRSGSNSPSAVSALSSEQVKMMLQPGPPANLGFVGNPSSTTDGSTATSTTTAPLSILTCDHRPSATATVAASAGIAAVDATDTVGSYVSRAGSYDETERSHHSSLVMGNNAMTVLQLSPQPPRGIFLQEFFPMTLNMYAASGRGALRHDLMEHPLQAIAASRGMGTVVFSRAGNSSSNGSNSKSGTGSNSNSNSNSSGYRNRPRGNSESISGLVANQNDVASICSERSDGSELGNHSPTGNSNSSATLDPLQSDLESIHRALQLAVALKYIDSDISLNLVAVHSPQLTHRSDDSDSGVSSPGTSPDKLTQVPAHELVLSLGRSFSLSKSIVNDATSYSSSIHEIQPLSLAIEDTTVSEDSIAAAAVIRSSYEVTTEVVDITDKGVQTSPMKKDVSLLSPLRPFVRVATSHTTEDDANNSSSSNSAMKTVPYHTSIETEITESSSSSSSKLRVSSKHAVLSSSSRICSSTHAELDDSPGINHSGAIQDADALNRDQQSAVTIQEDWLSPSRNRKSTSVERSVERKEDSKSISAAVVKRRPDTASLNHQQSQIQQQKQEHEQEQELQHQQQQQTQSSKSRKKNSTDAEQTESRSRSSRSKKGGNTWLRAVSSWLNKRYSAIERSKAFRNISAMVRSCQEKLLSCLELLSLDHLGEMINQQLQRLHLTSSHSSLVVALFYSMLMILTIQWFSTYGNNILTSNQQVLAAFQLKRFSLLSPHSDFSAQRATHSKSPSMNNSVLQSLSGAGSLSDQSLKRIPPATHWVRLGDSISFGDFSLYEITRPSSAKATAPLTANTNNKRKQREPTFSPTSFFREGSQADVAAAVEGVAGSGSGVGQAAGFGDCLFEDDSLCGSADSDGSTDRRSNTGSGSAFSQFPKQVDAQGVSVRVIYQWARDGKIIPHTHHNKPYYSIKRSQIQDAGLYQCFKYTYYNNDGDVLLEEGGVREAKPAQKELVVETIIQISKEPKVKTRPSYQEVTVGTTVFLNLNVEAHPPPAFQWYKNGYLMPGEESQALVMEKVNHSHSGTYSCDVQNIAGGYVWLEATVLVTASAV